MGHPYFYTFLENCMSKLHIYIDGSWLFKVCNKTSALAKHMADNKLNETKHFPMDFEKLNTQLLKHAQVHNAACTEHGDLFFCTSIFNAPNDLDNWPNSDGDITDSDIKRTRSNIYARERFAKSALDSGYSDEALLRPQLKKHHIKNIKNNVHQEKQVDTTVVALLIKNAFFYSEDFHCVISGDADIMPAIKVAYPEFAKNVFVATSHPDELLPEDRMTSYEIANFDFNVPIFYFQENIEHLMAGDHVYQCRNHSCMGYFSQSNPMPSGKQPYCYNCRRAG